MFHYDLTVSNQEVFYGHYKACQAEVLLFEYLYNSMLKIGITTLKRKRLTILKAECDKFWFQ